MPSRATAATAATTANWKCDLAGYRSAGSSFTILQSIQILFLLPLSIVDGLTDCVDQEEEMPPTHGVEDMMCTFTLLSFLPSSCSCCCHECIRSVQEHFDYRPFFSPLLGSTRQPPIPREMGTKSNCRGKGIILLWAVPYLHRQKRRNRRRENKEWNISNIRFRCIGKVEWECSFHEGCISFGVNSLIFKGTLSILDNWM